MVAEAAQVGGVEVHALVGEAPPFVDVEYGVIACERLQEPLEDRVLDHVLAVDPSQQRGSLVEFSERHRSQAIEKTVHCLGHLCADLAADHVPVVGFAHEVGRVRDGRSARQSVSGLIVVGLAQQPPDFVVGGLA